MSRAALAVALAVALFATGWWQGAATARAAAEARAAALLAERDRAAARIAGLTEALARERAARAALSRHLEDAADADDDADRVSLPARSLRRLDAR